MNASVGPVLSEARPFPGLRPFDAADFAFFFGRTEQVYSLYLLIDRNPFVAVVGGSGSGKSSLVRAGLLPLLETETADKETKGGGGRKWLHRTLRPGSAPIGALTEALVGLSPPEEPAIAGALKERIDFDLRRSSFGVADALSKIGNLEGSSVLLVVDQFEELFRYGTSGRSADRRDPRHEEADRFVQLLLEAARSQAYDVRILLTMRSDFIGDCARFPGLPEVVSASQFLVPALTRNQLEEVIRLPIEKVNAVIWPELVERLLNESADEEDRLPVLQHCLLRLWEQSGRESAADPPRSQPDHAADGTDPTRPRREINTEHYEAIGGVATALSQHAEEVFGGLNGLELTVEQIFRALSELDKDGRATRRAIPLSQLIDETGLPEADIRSVLERFRSDDCSFLLPSPSVVPVLAADTMIDVGHEAFLRRWRRISGGAQAAQRGSAGKNEGWLSAEHHDAERYRAWLSMFESETGWRGTLQLLFMGTGWWRARRRTAAWAERYGGQFERVRKRLREGLVGRWVAGACGLVIVGSLASMGYEILNQQQHAAEMQNRMQTSADTMIDAVQLAAGKNYISARGALVLLNAAYETLNKLSMGQDNPETITLQVKYKLSASDIMQLLGDNKQTSELATEARKLEQPLFDAAPNDPARIQLMYDSTLRIADAIADQNLGRQTLLGALAEYQRAQGYAIKLASVLADNGSALRMQAIIHQKIGDIRQAQEDPNGAIKEYQAAIDICEGLVKRAPGNPAWRQELATSEVRLSQPLTKLERYDEAETLLRASLSIRVDLLKGDPEDAILQSHVATSHVTLARLLAQRNDSGRDDLTRALTEFGLGLAGRKSLADKDKDNAQWKTYLAPVYIDIGNILMRQGKYAQALDSFNEASAIRQQLVNATPDSLPFRQNLAESETAAAGALAKLARWDEATKRQRTALAIWQKLLTEQAGNVRVLRNLFTNHIATGDMLMEQKEPAGARDEYNEALKIAQAMADKGPSSVWNDNVALAKDRIENARATASKAN
jgi:tetratricopeptide (TPR) repeat protein/energy-coupling factor transporter ATP-binding protein EcfA2